MHVMSPNRFETTSRGGSAGTVSIRIDCAVWTRFNRLDLDPGRRPLASSQK